MYGGNRRNWLRIKTAKADKMNPTTKPMAVFNLFLGLEAKTATLGVSMTWKAGSFFLVSILAISSC